MLANKPDTLNESVVMAGEYANTQIFLNELKDQNFDNSIQDRYDDLNERYGEMAQRLVRLQSLDSLYGLIDLFDETIAEANARLQLQMDQKMGQTNWVKMGDLYTKQIKTAQAVLTGQPSIPVFAPSFHDYFYLKPDLRSEAVVKDSEGKEWNLTDTESILADGGPSSAELESMVRLVRNKLEKEFEATYDPDEEVDYEGTSGLVFINWQQALADASAAAINPSTCNLAESMDECARNIMQSGYTVGLVEGGTFGRHHFEEYYRALTIRNFFDQMEADGRAMRESTGGRMGRDFGTNLTAIHRGTVRNMDWALNTLERNSKYVQMLQVANRQLPITQAQIGAARRGLDQYEDMNQRVRVGLSKGWQRNDDEIDAVIKVGGTIVAGVLYAVSFVFPPAAAVASGILAAVGSYSGVRGSYEGGTKGALAGAASVVPAIVTKGAVNTNLSYTFQEGWSAGVGAQVTKGIAAGVNYSEQAGWGGNVSIGLGDSPFALDLSVGEYGRYGAGLTYNFIQSPNDVSNQLTSGLRVGFNQGPEGNTYSLGLNASLVDTVNSTSGSLGLGLTYNKNFGTGFYVSGGAGGGTHSGGLGTTAQYNWSRFGEDSTTFGLTYSKPRDWDGSDGPNTPAQKNLLDLFLASGTGRTMREFFGDVSRMGMTDAEKEQEYQQYLAAKEKAEFNRLLSLEGFSSIGDAALMGVAILRNNDFEPDSKQGNHEQYEEMVDRLEQRKLEKGDELSKLDVAAVAQEMAGEAELSINWIDTHERAVAIKQQDIREERLANAPADSSEEGVAFYGEGGSGSWPSPQPTIVGPGYHIPGPDISFPDLWDNPNTKDDNSNPWQLDWNLDRSNEIPDWGDYGATGEWEGYDGGGGRFGGHGASYGVEDKEWDVVFFQTNVTFGIGVGGSAGWGGAIDLGNLNYAFGTPAGIYYGLDDGLSGTIGMSNVQNPRSLFTNATTDTSMVFLVGGNHKVIHETHDPNTARHALGVVIGARVAATTTPGFQTVDPWSAYLKWREDLRQSMMQ